MSNDVVMLFYIYTLKLNETYLIPLHVHGVQKKTRMTSITIVV